MIPRWLQSAIEESLRYRRVVHITGARQSGKTTVARSTPLEHFRRYTMDDGGLLETAKGDPFEFTKRKNGETIVIDEVQKAPELLDAIKMHVDESTERGQYLLTGSSSLEFMRKSADSLAGRIHTVRLRTLTLGEINGCKPSFLDNAFRREFKESKGESGKREIIRLAFCGGYPETLDFPQRVRREWYHDYLRTLIMRDVKNVTQIRKVDVLGSFAEWLLARSSKLWTWGELCAVTQVSKETAGSYVSAMEALYLIDKVPSWSKNDYDRASKSPKYFATDTGLMANCLNWDEESTYLDSDLSGKIIESWAYHELSAVAECSCGSYEMAHYRDKDKREIDFLVTNDQGEMLGIEVKAGGRVGREDFNHLKWFAANLAQQPFTGIVLYSGANILRFGEGFYAVPLSSLGA